MHGEILVNPQLLRDESVATTLDSRGKKEEVVDENKPLFFIEQCQSESLINSNNTLGKHFTTPIS